jgi:hypothetical protein
MQRCAKIWRPDKQAFYRAVKYRNVITISVALRIYETDESYWFALFILV